LKSVSSLSLVKTMNKLSLIISINNLTHMKSINSLSLVKTIIELSIKLYSRIILKIIFTAKGANKQITELN
jgi:hypothetical protein